MKYIKIPRELRKDIKIKEKDIEEIRELSCSGWSQRKIAARMGVSKFAVSYYLLTPEKREEMKLKQAAYKQSHPRSKEKRNHESRQTYATRKEALGQIALKQNSLSKLEALSPEEKIKSFFFHKQKLQNLLEVDPLLILLRSREEKIIISTL